jgi:AmmeMemoRadiSam system protein A
MLTRETRQQLLQIAHDALEARVRRRPAPGRDPTAAALCLCQPAFVTIFCKGELRGCLGRLTPEMTLPDLVSHLAREVADSDPRFDPVRLEELNDISLEISVLTPEREIRTVSEIEIGRHGLIVEKGSRRGLLLPQVATEHGWDRDKFVAQACLKAGLAIDAWRHGARIFVFEAQVFGEADRG